MPAPPISIIEFDPADDMEMNLLQQFSRLTSHDGSNKPNLRRMASHKRDKRPKMTFPDPSTRCLDIGNYERSESSLKLRPSNADTDKPPMPPKRTRSTNKRPANIHKEASKTSANDSFESMKSKPDLNLVVVNETRAKSQYRQRKSGMASALVDAFNDSKSSVDSQTTPNRRKHLKGIREKSLRSVLRNKRKLEKELSLSSLNEDVIIHKCKMPLEMLLQMKQASKRYALRNSLKGDSGAWQQESLEFHQLPRDAGLAGEEDESLMTDKDEEDCGSVVSLTVQDLTGSYSKTDATTASMTEDVESQALSLCLDDMCPDVDENKKIIFKEHTTDLPIVDPSGRMGTYAGTISRSSGLPSGTGRLEYHDTGEIFEGRFVHGFWAGYGKCIYPSGDEYTGFFQVSIRHGHGIMNYSDGRSFDGTYTHGIKVEGRMTYQDGSVYVGQWSKGARHGKGTYTFLNGAVFLGEFCNDAIHGNGILTWSNGGRYVGQWRNGVRHGQGTDFRPDGTIRFNGIFESSTASSSKLD